MGGPGTGMTEGTGGRLRLTLGPRPSSRLAVSFRAEAMTSLGGRLWHSSPPPRHILAVALNGSHLLPPYDVDFALTVPSWSIHRLPHSLTLQTSPHRTCHGLTGRGSCALAPARFLLQRRSTLLPASALDRWLAPNAEKKLCASRQRVSTTEMPFASSSALRPRRTPSKKINGEGRGFQTLNRLASDRGCAWKKGLDIRVSAFSPPLPPFRCFASLTGDSKDDEDDGSRRGGTRGADRRATRIDGCGNELLQSQNESTSANLCKDPEIPAPGAYVRRTSPTARDDPAPPMGNSPITLHFRGPTARARLTFTVRCHNVARAFSESVGVCMYSSVACGHRPPSEGGHSQCPTPVLMQTQAGACPGPDRRPRGRVSLRLRLRPRPRRPRKHAGNDRAQSDVIASRTRGEDVLTPDRPRLHLHLQVAWRVRVPASRAAIVDRAHAAAARR
ncbi:hypothetical protein OF83DRAFT_78105 [Amylostereum chailletii]|nr:hypothetical protein OF83DRAFT_78105 [Amylostereum chailletii]